jgi:aminoglycoside phosphotransferase family enzyme/predicted kinase
MDALSQHEAIVRWLAGTEAYPHRPDGVQHVETHISHVFLAGEYVYKLKKPVRYDFLDFSTAAAREHACREELRLNRRLASDTYIDVLPVVRDASGGFLWQGPGEVVDWVVQMRRLPTELTLDSLVRRDELRPEQIDRLAQKLARFYSSLPPLSLAAGEYRQHCLAHVGGNLRELLVVKHRLPRGVVERVHGFQLQLLRLRPAIFDDRVSAGRIVEGHGDLRPEHIVLGNEIVIFDCLEFSPDLRRLDLADELSFLAAECDFLDAEWVGPRLFQAYEAQSGDRLSGVLIDFYKSYRACVRAKVAALRAEQLAGSSSEAAQTAAEEMHRHLSLADRYVAPRLRPLLVVVGGLSGTGKTTLARAVAEALGGELLRTDILRREVFGDHAHAAAADAGIYQPAARLRVYERLFSRAAEGLAHQASVVLDGTFSTIDALAQAQRLAGESNSELLAIECFCRPETAQERIRRRLADGSDASQARPEIHVLQKEQWQPWPADIPQVRIDTEQPLEKQIEQVMAALAAKSWPQVDAAAAWQRC